MTGRPTTAQQARQQQWLLRVDGALQAQGLPAAAAVAEQALADGVEDPALLNLVAAARHGDGRFEEAVTLLQSARRLAPKDPHVANTLGVCLQALGRFDEALKAYDAAIRADPRMAAAQFNRGTVLEELNDIGAARAAFAKAAELDPNYVEPLASLAWREAQAGEWHDSRRNAERALALSPHNVLARMTLTAVDLQARDLASAKARLTGLVQDPALTSVNRSIVTGLVGDLMDAEGRPADAFRAYHASNLQLNQLYAPQFERSGTESALDRVRRLTGWFEAADPRDWRGAPAVRARASAPKAHVFLVGFPRSGTTLLENVLAAHPEVVALEESDCLEQVAAPFLASEEGLERLAAIDDAEAQRQRESYWKCVRADGIEPRGKLFVDKMPLASIMLPVIAKLFPQAKVLFALRDPRDVVLSCFRRRFGMNPAMYELLSLDGAAAYYDAVMRLSEVYRGVLALAELPIRYESLVEDFEGTMRGVCGFLGIAWDERLRDFAASARTRAISTPSSSQVVRGLNRDGQGVWRRYAEQMAPVLPLLQPWVERFGYAQS